MFPPPEPHSEADTRQELIDEQLRRAGWVLSDPAQVVEELDIHLAGGTVGAVSERARREYRGHQFVDYALKLRG